jgi:hypothetical protein
MRHVSLRSRCLWKADEIVDATVRYVRNGGHEELAKGDFSVIDQAVYKLQKLRNTALTRSEHEAYERAIWRAVNASRPGKIPSRSLQPNVMTIPEADAIKRRWGIGPVNRPRLLPRNRRPIAA